MVPFYVPDEPTSVMLRLMFVVVRTLVVLAALSCASCAKGTATPDNYAVSWRVSADQYNDAASEAAVSRCASLPGARRGEAEPQSRPPVPQLVFSGSAAQRRRLEACLLALPNAVIYGPSHGQAQAPVLRR
jgi:hypothetical protein